MTIQIELNPEMEAKLVVDAEANGLAPESYAQRLLQKAIGATGPTKPRATQEEFRAFLDEFASIAPDVPSLHNETFSRAVIYGDHD